MSIEHLFAGLAGDSDAQIVQGSVGWEDEDEFAFDDDVEDGHTLVRVQLFEGRDWTKPINPKRAQGHKIICHISSLNGRRVPAKDSRVFVAIPKGQANVPGAGVIFAAIEPQPKRAGNLKVDETVVVGPDGSMGRTVMKKDGTVALITSAGNDPAGGTVAFVVSPSGFKFISPYGSLTLDATGFHVKTMAGPRIDMGGMNIPGLPSEISGALTGYCTISSPMFTAKGQIVRLGPGPTYIDAVGATGAQYALPSPVTSGSANQSCTVQISLP